MIIYMYILYDYITSPLMVLRGLEQLGLSFICPDQFTDRGLELLGAGLPESLKSLALALEFSHLAFSVYIDLESYSR